MSMRLSQLAEDLQSALGKAAEPFTAPADFERHLHAAARSLARRRPLVRAGSVHLESGRPDYALPDDFVALQYPLWGRAEQRSRKPWDPRYPGPLPRARVVVAEGTSMLMIGPPPTAGQIAQLGAAYPFRYRAAHTLSDQEGETTVPEADRDLLLLRAMAEAMRELAASNVVKPVQLHRGVGSVPASGTPQALHEQLLAAYHREVAA